MPLMLGIDTGGTYTDAVLYDDDNGLLASAKALTTRHDLSVGIGGAIDAAVAKAPVTASDISLVSLSTTLATNALVEGHGGRVCLVMIGFEPSALERGGLADAVKGDPVIFIDGGHDGHGQQKVPLDESALIAELEAHSGGVSAFAVTGMFGVRNAEHETAVRDIIIARTGRPVTCSHELSSKLDGPKRALTCVLNARLINLIHHLISATETQLEARNMETVLMVVRGDGALISAEVAKVRPIETILSGPAASLVGAAYLTGLSDALVSDIGGTTTDVAVLRGGQPKLNADGAVVGGWRTMVEAVDMHTVGLGGDSAVEAVSEGRGTRLTLGPRRLLPVSLLAIEYPALVHETLERQSANPRPGEFDGRFAIAVDRESAHRSHLSSREEEVLARLIDGPAALDRLLANRRQKSALARLVSCGLAVISGLTPSDAAHVLSMHDAWDDGAARKAADLFARKENILRERIAVDGDSLSHWIIETLVRRSAETVLEVSCADDRFGPLSAARQLLAEASRSDTDRLVNLRIALSVPVIGLGASAPVYYPAVAAKLLTDAAVPEHAGVANAVGAVVGQVRVSAEGMISQLERTLFRVFAGEAPRDFRSLDDAMAFSERTLRDEARRRAVEAGADDIEITFSRSDNTAVVDGEEILVESRLKAAACGRPRIAN